jgi:Arc/MetJ-type ribon-helix-helix transcriptional regulator
METITGSSLINSNSQKVKTSVSIDQDLARFIDEKIEEKIFSSRSHAINFALFRLREGNCP